MMHLSVVIPTKNRVAMLDELLKSILSQTLVPDKFEVIIVDNGSEDQTKVVWESYRSQIKYLNYVFENRPGLHNGRHTGLRAAKGDILVFADDDIRALPTWLEGIAEAFEKKNVMLVGGKCLPLFNSQPPLWLDQLWQKQNPAGRILPVLSLLDLGDSIKEISPNYVFGCNFSIRRHILLEAGGFHPDAMPPELIRYRGDGETHVSQFVRKKGYQTLYHPKASVYHSVSNERMTEHYFCKRSYAQGISDSYTQLRNGGFKYHWMTLTLKSIKHLPALYSDRRGAQVFSAYLKGYYFHRREVRKDPELKEWVHRKNYLESM
jgi:glycosyltransferase involved in cell wall biosynthesis